MRSVFFHGLTLGTAGVCLSAEPASLDDRWNSEVLPLMENYCYDCHGDGLKKGELALDRYGSIEDMQRHRDVWKRIRDHIRHQLMPPLDEDQPDDAERKTMISWIDDAVFPVDPDHPDPGRVTLRRLNRIEYQNTLRDLLGVPVEVMDLIPPDDSGYGFDNIGDVLTLSPSHLERYLEAARVALDRTVFPDPMPRPEKIVHGRGLEGPGRRSEDGHYLSTNSEASAEFRPSRPGQYRVIITACGTMGGDTAPRMELRMDGETIGSFEVAAPLDRAEEFVSELRFDHANPVRVSVAFTNDFYDENHEDPARRDRNLMVRELRIIGPLDGPPPRRPQSHRRIYLPREKDESEKAHTLRILGTFARKAFRRPPREGEVERYLDLVELARKQGESRAHGIRIALEAMLISPAFLYREEPQPEPEKAAAIHRIDEHALATRLSYFFWSTMPDERLSGLADRGQLRKNLEGEIERMIRSPRFRQFVSNFTGQWLRLRDVPTAQPGRKAFPNFNPKLRNDMRRETELLFDHIIRENLPVRTLLDADFTFVNADLARHYGIEGVEGGDFRKVAVSDERRRGLLGHGSFHLLTSYPLRTSPVLRGKYVLENLLDTEPPPPPPNTPQLEPPSRHGEAASLREQMEKHREDPSCASCHKLMDPIGFALENFDASGAWRDQENGKPIDASGELLSGRKFAGVSELREILLQDHRTEFHRSVASRLLTYALGRGLEWYDKPAIDRIVAETEAAGGSSHAMLRAVIHSVPFQYRRGDS